MSVDSFAKIDMSLDDIIKLNKKEKKKALTAKKNAASSGKKLTVAQKKKAQALKIKARYTKFNKAKGQGAAGGKRTPRFKTNAAKRGNLARKNRTGLTRGGKVNAARNRQLNKTQGPNTNKRSNLTQQTRRPVTAPRSRGAIQNRLGDRISNAQTNQRLKRQQIMNKNRRGLSVSRGNRNAGRQASNSRKQRNNNNYRGNNSQRGRNRQYNQQPRRPARQGQRKNNNIRGKQRQTQQRSTGYYGNNQRRSNNFNRGGGRRGRGRGGAAPRRNERSVTLY